MTLEELKKRFYEECTETDKAGITVIKGTADELIHWIENKFFNAYDASVLFEKAFTGMHDKNKKPIHEGDKIKLYYKGEYVICQVIYDIKNAAFFLKWPDGYVNQYFMNGSNYEIVDKKKL